MLVVEYKDADRWTDDDSRDRRKVGTLWADLSNSRRIFVMPRGKG
jgi:type III restriction enzyme